MQATQLRNVRCAGLVFLPALGGHTGHSRHGNTSILVFLCLLIYFILVY